MSTATVRSSAGAQTLISEPIHLPTTAYVRGLLDEALLLPGLAPMRSRLQRLVDDYERTETQRDAPLVLALVGATGAGKSTLLNALAGQRLAQEGEHRPTSRDLTLYAPESAVVSRLEDIGARITRYSTQAGNPWVGQVFVDTPDLNSVELSHRDVARRALEQADVAIVVMHRGSVAEAVQAEFLSEFAARRRLVFAINHADQLTEASREDLKRQVRTLATQRLGLPANDVQVFAISAREGKSLATAGKEFIAFIEALRTMASRAVTERIRQSNATAILGELQKIVTAAVNETNAGLEEIRTALDQSLKVTTPSLLEDFGAQLTAATGHLSAQVRKHASARWWGPVAWWMRLSALGIGGLGAASLVGRANLPAGLALAAASTVLSRVQERTRAAATESQVTATIDEETLSAARSALAPARTAASLRGLSELALPEPSQLGAQLHAAKVSAWRHCVDRALGEQVERWWSWARWLLLPIVNLPLLALLGHVIYRVARAYVEGPLLSAEYFLNAAAFAVALSAVGAVLASWTLAGVTRKARRAGIKHLEKSLGAISEELMTALSSTLKGPRAAAAALSTLEDDARLARP